MSSSRLHPDLAGVAAVGELVGDFVQVTPVGDDPGELFTIGNQVAVN